MNTERVLARLAVWMTVLMIVAVSLLGWAVNLAFDEISAGREDVAKANRRLDTALELLRDADADAGELLEGQRTLAAQLEAAGIVPAIDVPPRQPRRSADPVRPVSSQPDRTTTTTTRPAATTTTTGPTSTSTTSTSQSTTTTTRCLVLMLGCELPLGGPGR